MLVCRALRQQPRHWSNLVRGRTWLSGICGRVSTYNAGCRCDECRQARTAANRRFYERHSERILERNRAYYAANRETEIAKSVERQRRDPEGRRAAAARWRAKNPGYRYYNVNPDRAKATNRRFQRSDKGKAYQREWRSKNATKVTLYYARARILREQAEVLVITPRDWERLCRRYDDRCAYCGSADALTQDHIVPLSRGGRHSIGNLLPACQPCNSSKHARLLIEWLAERRSRTAA